MRSSWTTGLSARRMGGRLAVAVLAVLSVTGVVVPEASSSVVAAPVASGDEAADGLATTAYTAVSPTRVLDSRIGLGVPARLGTGASFVLTIAGRAPVPAGATAVVLNVTVANAGGPGFVTAWPADKVQPTTSVINYEVPGQTIANLVTVPMDGAGRVAFFTQTETDLIADVQGYYTPAVASRAGRLVALTPARVLDTRAANPIAFGPVLAGQSVDIDFRPWGVAPDAIAVVLNVTVTDATAPGYWTAFATGTTRPVASNLNVIEAGQTVPNQVITPLSEGRATIFSQSGGHLIIDISGYYTGASSARGRRGTVRAGDAVPLARHAQSLRLPGGEDRSEQSGKCVGLGTRWRHGEFRGCRRDQRDGDQHQWSGILLGVAERHDPTNDLQPQRGPRRPDDRQPRDHARHAARLRLLHAVGGRPHR